jgi:hypothetical protein
LIHKMVVSCLGPALIGARQITNYSIAIDVVDALKSAVIPKSDVIRWLKRPMVSNRMKIAMVLFDYVNPRVILVPNHGLDS